MILRHNFSFPFIQPFEKIKRKRLQRNFFILSQTRHHESGFKANGKMLRFAFYFNPVHNFDASISLVTKNDNGKMWKRHNLNTISHLFVMLKSVYPFLLLVIKYERVEEEKEKVKGEKHKREQIMHVAHNFYQYLAMNTERDHQTPSPFDD